MGRFFRLVVAERHRHSGQLAGVFVAAHGLLRSDVAPSFERIELEGLLDWFGANLRVPRPVNGRAISWFKGTASPCSRRIWELA